jgi:hypothetical protein
LAIGALKDMAIRKTRKDKKQKVEPKVETPQPKDETEQDPTYSPKIQELPKP